MTRYAGLKVGDHATFPIHDFINPSLDETKSRRPDATISGQIISITPQFIELDSHLLVDRKEPLSTITLDMLMAGMGIGSLDSSTPELVPV